MSRVTVGPARYWVKSSTRQPESIRGREVALFMSHLRAGTQTPLRGVASGWQKSERRRRIRSFAAYTLPLKVGAILPPFDRLRASGERVKEREKPFMLRRAQHERNGELNNAVRLL
jgi:hypothetical protein